MWRNSSTTLDIKKNQNINFQELLYADDALIIAKSAKTANAYLHLIEQESEYLHLRLIHDKCNYKFQYQRRQNQISKWNHDEVNDGSQIFRRCY